MPKIDKKWTCRNAADEEVVQGLMQNIGIGKTLASLMAQREINNYSEAKQYFNPSANQLHNPFLMKDMQLAVDRIKKAFDAQEKILIYGDYDVDGTTSVALVYSYLKNEYPHLGYYIPDRHQEGYGISFQGIDYAKDNGYTLVIALDCGTKAVDKIAYASEQNIDFIVCDHHTPGNELPIALAILNPKQADCQYPYPELCGCGIGFKLICGLYEQLKLKTQPLDYIDLVCIAIGADIVPLTGENRILAALGLEKINSEPGKGIESLINVSGFKGNFSISDIVFKLAPRINAAGRVSHGNEAVEMLIGQSDALVEKAATINQHNEDRKNIDKEITDECLAYLSEIPEIENLKTTVVFQPHWHKGVIGIVASRLIEQYYRPTVVLTQSDDGFAVGSVRSVEGFNVYEALDQCKSCLIQFGGHSMAAGLTLELEEVENFKKKFEVVVSETIDDEILIPKIYYDMVLPIERITWSLHKSIDRLGPFGPENMQPCFVSENVASLSARVLGNKHLKFNVFNGIQHLECLAFGHGNLFSELNEANSIDICYTLDKNSWQGNEQLQLLVKDIKIRK